MFRLAQLPNADWAQAQIGTTDEAEDDSKDKNHGCRVASWEPESEASDEAEANAEDERVDSSDHISNQSGEEASEKTASIEHGNDLEAECGAEAMVCAIGSEVCQRDEDAPFHQKDSKRETGKGHIFEKCEVWRDTLEARHRLEWETTAHQQVGYAE